MSMSSPFHGTPAAYDLVSDHISTDFEQTTETSQSILVTALDAWQDWSDATSDDKYREAILTLIEGLVTLVGYLAGFAYCWLVLQCVRTVRYWLTEAVQAIPVLRGWWAAPSIEVSPTQYPESCWQVIAPATLAAILDDELDWACAAEVRVAIG